MALTKTQSVMEFENGDDVSAYFVPVTVENPEDMAEEKFNYLRFDINDWEDMGKPLLITITIEAGDMLNNATL